MATIDYLQLFPQSFLNRLSTSNLGKLWKMFSDQVDDIEASFLQMKTIFQIFTVTGENLDQIGTLVLLDREPGQTDDSYRLALSVAISEKKSGGSIPELAEIGKIVAGNDPNAVFRVDEQWDKTGEVFLDGQMLLEGTDPLDPSLKRSASIISPLAGNIDDIVAPLEVGDTIGRIRAGGVFAAFEITFQDLVSQMTKYTIIYSTLDSLQTLDGKQLLTSDGEYNIYEIALGDGGTRDPLPGDTGLQNEVFREIAVRETDGNGQLAYTIDIAASELNAYTINELGAFDLNGNLVLKDYFEGKPKNQSLIYNYQIIDNEN